MTSVENSPAPAVVDHQTADFRFLPKGLTTKCRELIEAYHDSHGYSGLADILWSADTRDFIEFHSELHLVFKRASSARSAKKARDGLVMIATLILSLEVLASNFAGWGRRFPFASRRADALLGELVLNSRTRLMDVYLYPKSHRNPALLSAAAAE